MNKPTEPNRNIKNIKLELHYSTLSYFLERLEELKKENPELTSDDIFIESTYLDDRDREQSNDIFLCARPEKSQEEYDKEMKEYKEACKAYSQYLLEVMAAPEASDINYHLKEAERISGKKYVEAPK